MELCLIVTIAGQRVALRAADVQSAIEVDALSTIPRAPDHIAGLLALRSRVLTAIDCSRCVGHGAGANAPFAAIVEHDGHPYALLVEAVDDVVASASGIEPMCAPVASGWAAMTCGMIETAEGPLLVIDPAAMIGGPAETPQRLKAMVTGSRA